MKVQKDTFLIRVDTDRTSDTGIVGANGETIKIDVDYNKYKHTTRVGQIFACPISITEQYGYDTPLKVGDTVVFHHFVCQKDHKVEIPNEQNIYRAEYFHLYAKLSNWVIGGFGESGMEKRKIWNIEPLEDIIFVEPILESEESLYAGKIRIKTHQENLKQTGIVFAASRKAQDAGIQDGDKVFFTANADYQMNVVGNDLYRMRIRNIIAIERNSELICLNDKILVKEISRENKSGIFTDVNKSHQMTGFVEQIGKDVKGIEAGSIISYYAGALGTIDYKCDRYALIETRHINYIIE